MLVMDLWFFLLGLFVFEFLLILLISTIKDDEVTLKKLQKIVKATKIPDSKLLISNRIMGVVHCFILNVEYQFVSQFFIC